VKLIDSNIVIYAAQPSYAYLRPLLQDPANAVSAVTRLEVLGFHRLSLGDKTYFASVFALLQVLDVNTSVIEQAILLRQQRNLSVGDAIIAATALLYQMELYTHNTMDFAGIVSLVVVDPV
jgi:predicted nucleic acid-binding protein